jgi:hypothetical protein
MDGLFLVDRDAREKQMSIEQRLSTRREHAAVWAEEIREECRICGSNAVRPARVLARFGVYTNPKVDENGSQRKH